MRDRGRKSGPYAIRRSCLTGNAVWARRCRTKKEESQRYWRACRAEIERVRRWPETAARRKAAILDLLSRCTARLSAVAEMTPDMREAARQLVSIAEKGMPCHMEFYEHIMEERRRRKEDREIRRRMRERDSHKNSDYGKQEGKP